MTLFNLLALLYLFAALHCLAAAARQCLTERTRFLLADELLLALFWPFVLTADILRAWKITKRFPGKW